MIDPDAIWPTPDWNCAARNWPHGPHQLAGPGGAKPGAHCGGNLPPAHMPMPQLWDGDDS